jgi:hypothetical protein
VLVFVLLDEHSDNFHERSEGVRFVFADFIDEPIEQGNQSFIFGFGVGGRRRCQPKKTTRLPFCSRRDFAWVTPSTGLRRIRHG